MAKKLYRSETDKIIAGVCGGIAEYLNIDSAIIRIIFILASISEGFGLMLYIILWVVLPTKENIDKKPDEVIQENTEEIKENVVKATKGIRREVKSDTKKK
jgi:phage shock protein PspC (stress-responsive transcriptional regulator)